MTTAQWDYVAQSLSDYHDMLVVLLGLIGFMAAVLGLLAGLFVSRR